MLRTFLFEIAGCTSNFTVQNRQQSCINEIREKVDKSKVLVSELACVCCVCVHVSRLISCCFSQVSSCSLIRAGAPAVSGRKPLSRKCLPDTVPLALRRHQCQSDIYSSEEKEKRHSNPQLFPNPVSVESCPEWEVRPSVFVLSSVIDVLLIGVTEIHTGYSP